MAMFCRALRVVIREAGEKAFLLLLERERDLLCFIWFRFCTFCCFYFTWKGMELNRLVYVIETKVYGMHYSVKLQSLQCSSLRIQILPPRLPLRMQTSFFLLICQPHSWVPHSLSNTNFNWNFLPFFTSSFFLLFLIFHGQWPAIYNCLLTIRIEDQHKITSIKHMFKKSNTQIFV